MTKYGKEEADQNFSFDDELTDSPKSSLKHNKSNIVQKPTVRNED